MTDEIALSTQTATGKPRLQWGWWVAFGLLAAFLSLMGVALYRAQSGQVSHGLAPDFTLNQFDGGTFRLSEQRGTVVMVDFPWHRPLPRPRSRALVPALGAQRQVSGRARDGAGQVWASWCVPCREEARTLEALWQAYKDRGVVFVGVAYADTETESRAFLQEFGITYPNGPDLGTRISQAYWIRGVPEKFFIDRRGQVRAVVIGPEPEGKLRQQIEALLSEP